MDEVVSSSLVVLVVFTLNAQGVAGAPPTTSGDPGSNITLAVYNRADVPPQVLSRAKREAARVFRRAGVETTWVDCPRSEREAHRYPACSQLEVGRRVLVVTIVSSPSAGYKGHGQSFGLALISAGERFATYAYTFFGFSGLSDAFGKAAANRLLSPAVTLGHLMAHEVGHLLLGSNSHSSSGIMRPRWGRRELLWASQGRLSFTERQVRAMRQKLLERCR